ncbi:MAG: VCBS domain-containing protein, partial [Pseudomonadota bacterium]|nr:VCBS domain-containing protein [Pseudomonadota bacterium]
DGTRYELVSMQPCPQATEEVQKIAGQLVANDVDANAHLHFSLDAEVAGLTLDEDGAYRFDPSDSAYQFLPTGQTLEVVANWTVKDEHEATDSSTLTITVTGSSDAPLTSIAASEDGDVVEGQVENPDAATGYALIEAVAGVSVSADGSYRFDPTVAAYDSLANEEVREIIAVWKANGEDGTETNGVLFITLTGTNDAPSAVAATAQAVEDGDAVSGQLLASDADRDSVVGFAADGAVAGLVINQDGTYRFDPSDAAYQSIAQGVGQDVVASWIATDDLGATDTATLTITITGVNDGPAATAVLASATEGGEAVTGQLVADDVDNGASLTYRLVEAVDGLIVNEDGSYRFDSSDAAYQSLAQGETLDVVANWSVTDDHDTTDAGTLIVTVTGSNDGPVASALDGVAAAGELSAKDDDNNSSLTYALNEPVEGLTVNADGSYSFDLSLPAYRSLVAGETMVVEAQWTVTDNNEASASSTMKITLEGVNDAPETTPATAAVTEDDGAVVAGQLNASDADHNAALTYALDAPV